MTIQCFNFISQFGTNESNPFDYDLLDSLWKKNTNSNKITHQLFIAAIEFIKLELIIHCLVSNDYENELKAHKMKTRSNQLS